MFEIESFFDDRTSTLTYVVYDPDSRDAVVIDPVLDYDPAASTTWTESVDRVAAYLEAHELHPRLIAETHAHADHLSGSQMIKDKYPDAKVVIGEHIKTVQSTFKHVFDLPADFPTDGSQFDKLVKDGETLTAGTLAIDTIATPGHTPACVTFKVEDAIFTGDALFMPDMGTGRCDFPAGSATDLYRSITERLYTLPDDTRVFVGHDYAPGGREIAWETTIGEEKANNVQLPAGRSEKDYVSFREARDATLAAPKLLFQSVQVNVDAGALPQPADNEIRYLRIPVNVFRPEDAGNVELKEF